MRPLLAAIITGVALSSLATQSPVADPIKAYGSKVTFKRAQPLSFPDFTLEYTGERRARSEKFPRDFVYHDFVAIAGSERVTVSWSSGTGDIGPAIFAIAGSQFGLELVMSDTLGRLKPDDLVVSIRRRAP